MHQPNTLQPWLLVVTVLAIMQKNAQMYKHVMQLYMCTYICRFLCRCALQRPPCMCTFWSCVRSPSPVFLISTGGGLCPYQQSLWTLSAGCSACAAQAG